MILPRRARLGRLVLRAPFSTLTPSKLAASDWIYISGEFRHAIRYAPRGVPGVPVSTGSCIHFRHGGGGPSHPAFPPGTAGFLYAHTVPNHPAAGAVRLRLVPAPDAARFAKGADLLMPNGLPWAIPFPALVGKNKHAALLACLLREGIIRAEDVARWAGLRVNGRTQIVHGAGVPFFVDFAACLTLRLHVACGSSLEIIQLQNFASAEYKGPPRRAHPRWIGTSRRPPPKLMKLTFFQVPHISL
jgi:hypothetical protein